MLMGVGVSTGPYTEQNMWTHYTNMPTHPFWHFAHSASSGDCSEQQYGCCTLHVLTLLGVFGNTQQ